MTFDLPVTLEEAFSAAKVDARLPDGRLLAVSLPKGVEDGQQIRLKGQGPGRARAMRLPRCDCASIRSFRLEGKDLHVDLPVSLKDAVLGTKAPVRTLTGTNCASAFRPGPRPTRCCGCAAKAC